jgi:hypothetical protein
VIQREQSANLRGVSACVVLFQFYSIFAHYLRMARSEQQQQVAFGAAAAARRFGFRFAAQ